VRIVNTVKGAMSRPKSPLSYGSAGPKGKTSRPLCNICWNWPAANQNAGALGTKQISKAMTGSR